MPNADFSPAPASAGTKAGVELLSPQDYEAVIPNIPYPNPPVNQNTPPLFKTPPISIFLREQSFLTLDAVGRYQ
jgi:hypothetical protein